MLACWVCGNIKERNGKALLTYDLHALKRRSVKPSMFFFSQLLFYLARASFEILNQAVETGVAALSQPGLDTRVGEGKATFVSRRDTD